MRNLLLAFFVFLTASCSYHVFVPPGNVLNFQTPATLGKGEKAFTSGVGYSMKIMDYDITSGFIGTRYGIGNNSEIGFAVNALYFNEVIKPIKRYSPLSVGCHLSGKYNPEFAKKFLAFSSGIGGGVSDLGDYVNFNCNIISGFEHPCLVPFCYVGYYLGVPINPKPHDVTDVLAEEHFAIANITNGLMLGVGFRIQFPKKCITLSRFSLYGAQECAWLFSEFNGFFYSLGSGIEYRI